MGDLFHLFRRNETFAVGDLFDTRDPDALPLFDHLDKLRSLHQGIEQRQGIRIACIEEIAYRKGFITAEQVEKIAQPLLKSGYGQYLINIIHHS